MTDYQPVDPIETYLDPEFWGGHMIGDGDAKSYLEEDPYGPSDRQSIRYGKQVLKERLPLMQQLVPFQRFEKGMLFNADEHPLGTILLYKKQGLETISEGMAKIYVKYPFPLYDEPILDLNFGRNEGLSRIIHSDQLLYTAKTLWGVISQTRDGEPSIISYNQHGVIRTSSSNVRLQFREFFPQNPQFRIGEPRHFKEVDGQEKIDKITQLYICGYGRAKKARKTGRQLVNSLIPKPVLASPVLGINREI